MWDFTHIIRILVRRYTYESTDHDFPLLPYSFYVQSMYIYTCFLNICLYINEGVLLKMYIKLICAYIYIYRERERERDVPIGVFHQ